MTPPSPSGDPAGSGLERALQVFLDSEGASPTARQALLARHPDLREWLEPLLATDDPAAAPAAAAGGRRLGDYELGEELGRGGMGIVHAAWQRSLGRRVALKLLAPGLVDSPSAQARFRREAAAAARLRHPGIVAVHDFGSADGEHFFAMALVDGQPLHRCLDRFTAPAAAVALVLQVAEALEHAHEAGLVHRDVKPANLLVEASGTVRLTDFGLASDAALPSLTRDGAFLGTLDYAAPEQVRGEPVDARTDLWALGVILAELLAGAHPFRGPTQVATTQRILTAEAAVRRGPHGEVPRDLQAIVDRALAKDRSRRYATAAALAQDLRAWQRGEPVSARLPSTAERLWRSTRREPWRAAALLLLALGVPALAAVGGFVLAKAPAIAAGDQLLAAQQLEERLTEAWLAYTDGAPAQTLALLDAVADRSDETKLLRAMALVVLGRRDEALAALQQQTTPAAHLLLNYLRADSDQLPNAAAAPGAARDELAVYAQATQAYKRGLAFEDPADMKVAVRAAMQAIALAPAPRLVHAAMLAKAGSRAGDRAAAELGVAALERHFPGARPAVLAAAEATARFDPAKGVRQFNDLVARYPEQPRLHYWLGYLHQQLGQSEAAEAAYRRELAIDPGSAESWNNLGRLLRKRGDTAGAIAAYRAALAAVPTHVRAWNNLGNALTETQPDEAKTAFERALQLRPRYAKGHFNLGFLHHRYGEVDAAMACYRQAIDLQPDYAQPHCNLAVLTFEHGEPPQALALAERALELAPDQPTMLANVVEMSFALGETSKTAAAAQRWTAVAAKEPRAWAGLALARLAAAPPDLPGALAAQTQLDQLSPNPDLAALVAAHFAAARGEPAAARTALQAPLAGKPPKWYRLAAERLLARLPG